MAALVLFAQQQNQYNIRRERIFRDRQNTLECFNDTELISRYRFPRESIIQLTAQVRDLISKPTCRSHAIPANIQVLRTLRHLAKGDFFLEVAHLHGVSKSSVCRIINSVCTAINSTLDNISFPSTPEETRQIKSDFYKTARFPNCVGAIDGTLIPIAGLSGPREAVYVCRKNFHALNIQAVADANTRSLNMNTRFPGATHDSYILANSGVPALMQNQRDGGWLLGDWGYPLREWLMTPYINPNNHAEERYNEAHSKTRSVVERSFGLLKSRFRCLHKSGGFLPFKPDKCAVVIKTCFRLYNKAIDKKVPLRNGGNIAIHNNAVICRNNAPINVQQIRNQLAARF